MVKWTKIYKIHANIVPDSVVFLWHYQDESFSSRPDIFDDVEDGPNGEGSSWAESWGVLKILRGHLQVICDCNKINTNIGSNQFSLSN